MITKLTLTLEKEVIEKTKIYAKNRKTNLSRMVENYFKRISQDIESENPFPSLPPITAKLAGLGRKTGIKPMEDDKDALLSALEEKYLK